MTQKRKCRKLWWDITKRFQIWNLTSGKKETEEPSFLFSKKIGCNQCKIVDNPLKEVWKEFRLDFQKNLECRLKIITKYFQRNDLISIHLGVHQRDEEIFSHELYENTPKCARMKLFIRFNTISSSFYARNSSVVQSRKVLKWRCI